MIGFLTPEPGQKVPSAHGIHIFEPAVEDDKG